MQQTQEDQPTTNHRPIGFVQPADNAGRLAERAIHDGRINDAVRHAAGIAEGSPDARAWRALLLGLITIEQGSLSRAEPLLLEASALASEDAASATLLRVGTRALVRLGWLYRRTERCAEAKKVHLAAHVLNEEHGSFEELWESASELGLDADIARSFRDGQHWHRQAVEAARKAHEEPLKKQALAWTNLVTSHEAADQVEEAVEAARSAHRCWHEFDSGAVTAARADAKLGRALLKKGERLCRCGDPDEVDLSPATRRGAVEVLAEAVSLLTSARDGLLAFGTKHRSEADSCRDQESLAARLSDEYKPPS